MSSRHANKCSRNVLAIATAAGMFFPAGAFAEDNLPTREEMWKIIQQQQTQIDTLLNQQAKAEQKIDATAVKVDETVVKVEEAGQLARISPAAGPGWWERTQLGGYGEMHYNSGETDQIDFHRFVLFIGHDFNDRVRMFSELELEHSLAGEGQPGEVELEQAYVEFDIDEAKRHQSRAGLFLIPVGILNETHEPPTFFGVERNKVESNIIPTTWWEGGVAYSGEFGNGFSGEVAVHSGLEVPTSGSNAYKIRNGRQKVASAVAKDPAITGRIKWTGMPGVEVGVSGQWQRDITQSAVAESTPATLVEAHTDVRKGPFGLRVLGARWDVDGTGAEGVGRDVQQGWYAEPAYYFDTPVGEAGIFARYTNYDNEAGNDTDSDITEYNTGFNVWPHPDVVLKVDFQHIDAAPGGNSDDIVNLGVGFQF